MELIASSNLLFQSPEFFSNSEESLNPFEDFKDHEEGIYVFEEKKDYGKSYKIYQCIDGGVSKNKVWFKLHSIRVFLDGSIQSRVYPILVLKKISSSIPDTSDLYTAISKIDKMMNTEVIY
jgi:hypothetical protein